MPLEFFYMETNYYDEQNMRINCGPLILNFIACNETGSVSYVNAGAARTNSPIAAI